MSPSAPTPRADLRHDAANRERYALRKAMRESQRAERQRQRELEGLDDAIGAAKRTIEQDWRAQHYGKDHGRPLAWRAPAGAREPRADRRVSWQALRHGARVVSADGARLGAVERVLGDAKLDIFDGVIIDTRLGPGGRRFVIAADIAATFDDRIELALTSAQARDLPRPSRKRAIR